MIGILIVTILAFLLSLVIIILESKLQNKKNEKEIKFLEFLPGYNCGACGFGSCSGMAQKMCEDINNYKRCKPLKGEKLEKMQAYIDSL